MPGVGRISLPRLRQGLYRFFAAALLSPDEARVARLDSAAGLLEEFGVETLAFASPWLDMRRSLSMCKSLDALEADHIHLFESGSDGVLCPAIESFYVSSPRQGGPALVTADLEVEYQRLGLTVSEDLHLDVDHISPQLELMALLCANEATAGDDGDLRSVGEWSHEQCRFTDNHLSLWVPRLAARFKDVAPEGFYKSLVEVLDAFVDHDRDLLHVLERRERVGSER